MEIVLKSDLQDVYRFDKGVILTVYKCNVDKNYEKYSDISNYYNYRLKKISNNLYIFKYDEQIRTYNSLKLNYDSIVYKKGTILYKGKVVVPTNDVHEWITELNIFPKSLIGNISYVNKKITEIKDTIQEQYGCYIDL